ncbi:MAG: DNA repair protein RecO [Luteibaculaceae bacterium]
MHFTTEAIVLGKINYGDQDAIVKCFCEHKGVNSFYVRGLRAKKNKKLALLSPLNQVRITGTYQENKSLCSLKELSLTHPYQTIGQDFQKTAIAFFLGEFLSKILVEHPEDQELYSFLVNALNLLDATDQSANFHLVFLAKCMFYLGIKPIEKPNSSQSCFNFLEGEFQSVAEFHEASHLNIELSEKCALFLYEPFSSFPKHAVNRVQRQEILLAFLKFYKVRFDTLTKLNSLEVLEQIML